MAAVPPIRIAGAGPAGLSAAIGLARRGHRVAVFERNAGPGQARHAEWDAIENWTTPEDFLALLGDWGIAPTFAHRASPEFLVYDHLGRYSLIRTPRPLFYLIKRGPERGSLELALTEQARDHGVAIHYDQTLTRDRADIWAAGSRAGGFFLSTGLTFRTTHPDIAVGLVSTQHAPKAYAYLAIVDGEGTLAVVLTEKFQRARSYLDRSLALLRRFLNFDMTDLRPSSGFGGRPGGLWEPLSWPLPVGEAAGFQDFLWGFGIRHALHSGHLAARAIDEGRDYAQLVGRSIRPLVRASLVNRMLYDWAGDRTYGLLIRRFAASPDLPALLRSWYRGYGPSLALWPLASHRYRGRDSLPQRARLTVR